MCLPQFQPRRPTGTKIFFVIHAQIFFCRSFSVTMTGPPEA